LRALLWGGSVTPKSYDRRAVIGGKDVPSFAPAVGVTQTKEAHHDDDPKNPKSQSCWP